MFPPLCLIMNLLTITRCTSVDIGVNANLELVDKFCYLGDMLSVDAVSYTHLTLPTNREV